MFLQMFSNDYYFHSSSGHVEGGASARRGVMRRACDWVAWPVVACALLLVCDCLCAGEILAPGGSLQPLLNLYHRIIIIENLY